MVLRESAINKKTKNKKKHTFFEYFKKVFFWFIFFGFCAATIWTIVFSPVMKIREIEITGAVEDEQPIRDIVEKNIEGNYFDFIPRDNLMVAPFKKIEADIYNDFVMVRRVEIKRKFPAKTILEIERREKTVTWCTNSNCWLIDEKAEAFYSVNRQEVENLENDILVTDGSGKEIRRGDKVAHIEIINLCSNFQKIIQENGDIEIDNKSLYIPSPLSGEVRVRTKVGWEIFFSSERSLDRQVKILKKVLAAKIKQVDLTKLEYVDLRVKGKVVYRFIDYREREKELEEVEVMGVSDNNVQEKKTDIEKKDDKKKTQKSKVDNKK